MTEDYTEVNVVFQGLAQALREHGHDVETHIEDASHCELVRVKHRVLSDKTAPDSFVDSRSAMWIHERSKPYLIRGYHDNCYFTFDLRLPETDLLKTFLGWLSDE